MTVVIKSYLYNTNNVKCCLGNILIWFIWNTVHKCILQQKVEKEIMWKSLLRSSPRKYILTSKSFEKYQIPWLEINILLSIPFTSWLGCTEPYRMQLLLSTWKDKSFCKHSYLSLISQQYAKLLLQIYLIKVLPPLDSELWWIYNKWQKYSRSSVHLAVINFMPVGFLLIGVLGWANCSTVYLQYKRILPSSTTKGYLCALKN